MISRIPIAFRSLASNDTITRLGDTSTQCCFVFDGFLTKNKILGSAKRQITSFHLLGDLPDLQSLYLGKADHNLTALGPAIVGFVSHHSLKELFEQSPSIVHVFWRDTLVEAAILREWEVNLGGREAVARVAHLLCETAVRLQAVGMAKNSTFSFPWTQNDIGEACGLSNVHVNRVIKLLRATEAIEWRSKVVKVLNWPALQEIAGFSPDYLHLCSAGPNEIVNRTSHAFNGTHTNFLDSFPFR